jgi:PII-like signaling protein
MRWGREGKRARIDLVMRAAEAGRHGALVVRGQTGIDATNLSKGGRGTVADMSAAGP